MKNLKSSIIYVNFAPYENAGKILDFLLDTFEHVALFSFSFHKLGKKGKYNKLKIYRDGREIDAKNLLDFQVPEFMIFLFLPIRSVLIFAQILLYMIYLKHRFGKFYYYFTVNAFTSWVGNILKKIGLVQKTIFWVWDYYPPFHENKIIAFMRSLYWQFDKQATKSDALFFLNDRVAKLHKKIGIIDENKKNEIIPIGTTRLPQAKSKKLSTKSKIKLVFVGVIKKSQGFDLIFNNSETIAVSFPNLEINIIGAGPDLGYFKKRSATLNLNIKYHGYLLDKDIENILKNSHIGIATYIPNSNDVSYYGDPSKIKQYLSFGLPVITTNVFQFSNEIKVNRAGVLINYNKKGELVKAIKEIVNSYHIYKHNAINLSKKYYYKNLYPKIFSDY